MCQWRNIFQICSNHSTTKWDHYTNRFTSLVFPNTISSVRMTFHSCWCSRWRRCQLLWKHMSPYDSWARAVCDIESLHCIQYAHNRARTDSHTHAPNVNNSAVSFAIRTQAHAPGCQIRNTLCVSHQFSFHWNAVVERWNEQGALILRPNKHRLRLLISIAILHAEVDVRFRNIE